MNDVYSIVTSRIIAALEAGAPPWIAPWQEAGSPLPTNHRTNRSYRGINTLLLYAEAQTRGYTDNRWLTFRQAQALDGCVRKGERGTQIVFFKWLDVSEHPAANDEPAQRVVPLLRTFTVFNLDQIDGIARTQAVKPDWVPEDCAEALLAASGAEIRNGGNRACYSPTEDVIRMPPRAWFAEANGYYATALHELTHWTGHPSRCDRPLGRRFGLEAYAFEELVAEMGAAFLCTHCGLQPRLEHASYIDSWLQALRGDKRLIFTAASQAQKAADFITGYVAPVSEVAEQVAA